MEISINVRMFYLNVFIYDAFIDIASFLLLIILKTDAWKTAQLPTKRKQVSDPKQNVRRNVAAFMSKYHTLHFKGAICKVWDFFLYTVFAFFFFLSLSAKKKLTSCEL